MEPAAWLWRWCRFAPQRSIVGALCVQMRVQACPYGLRFAAVLLCTICGMCRCFLASAACFCILARTSNPQALTPPELVGLDVPSPSPDDAAMEPGLDVAPLLCQLSLTRQALITRGLSHKPKASSGGGMGRRARLLSGRLLAPGDGGASHQAFLGSERAPSVAGGDRLGIAHHRLAGGSGGAPEVSVESFLQTGSVDSCP